MVAKRTRATSWVTTVMVATGAVGCVNDDPGPETATVSTRDTSDLDTASPDAANDSAGSTTSHIDATTSSDANETETSKPTAGCVVPSPLPKDSGIEVYVHDYREATESANAAALDLDFYVNGVPALCASHGSKKVPVPEGPVGLELRAVRSGVVVFTQTFDAKLPQPPDFPDADGATLEAYALYLTGDETTLHAELVPRDYSAVPPGKMRLLLFNAWRENGDSPAIDIILYDESGEPIQTLAEGLDYGAWVEADIDVPVWFISGEPSGREPAADSFLTPTGIADPHYLPFPEGAIVNATIFANGTSGNFLFQRCNWDLPDAVLDCPE